MKLTTKPASAEDFDRLVELRILSMRESLESIGRFDRERSIERFRASFSPERTTMIMKEGVLVGFIAATEKSDHIYLDHLYVDPLFQSSGIGSWILKELIESSEEKGLPIRLGALRSSKSNGFYQKHGFVATDEDEWDIYYERKKP